MYFDDEFRDTGCPHATFAANDGNNNFSHHPDSYLSSVAPKAKALAQEAKWPNEPGT
jgi:hypothetical protein